MKKEKFIMKVLKRLTPAVSWSPFDHRANQRVLDNLDTLEKMTDYLLDKLSEDSALVSGNDDSEHCDIACKKRKVLERLRDKYFKEEYDPETGKEGKQE